MSVKEITNSQFAQLLARLDSDDESRPSTQGLKSAIKFLNEKPGVGVTNLTGEEEWDFGTKVKAELVSKFMTAIQASVEHYKEALLRDPEEGKQEEREDATENPLSNLTDAQKEKITEEFKLDGSAMDSIARLLGMSGAESEDSEGPESEKKSVDLTKSFRVLTDMKMAEKQMKRLLSLNRVKELQKDEFNDINIKGGLSMINTLAVNELMSVEQYTTKISERGGVFYMRNFILTLQNVFEKISKYGKSYFERFLNIGRLSAQLYFVGDMTSPGEVYFISEQVPDDKTKSEGRFSYVRRDNTKVELLQYPVNITSALAGLGLKQTGSTGSRVFTKDEIGVNSLRRLGALFLSGMAGGRLTSWSRTYVSGTAHCEEVKRFYMGPATLLTPVNPTMLPTLAFCMGKAVADNDKKISKLKKDGGKKRDWIDLCLGLNQSIDASDLRAIYNRMAPNNPLYKMDVSEETQTDQLVVAAYYEGYSRQVLRHPSTTTNSAYGKLIVETVTSFPDEADISLIEKKLEKLNIKMTAMKKVQEKFGKAE